MQVTWESINGRASIGPMKVKNAQIIPELWSLKWRHLEVFENSSFPSGVCEIFDAKYTSKKTEAKILSAWKFEVYRTQQKSKSRCHSSKAKCRVELTSKFRHGGLRLVRFVLQSTSICSPSLTLRVYSPCVCLSQCSRGSRECLHNAWPFVQDVFGNLYLLFVCVSS